MCNTCTRIPKMFPPSVVENKQSPRKVYDIEECVIGRYEVCHVTRYRCVISCRCVIWCRTVIHKYRE